MNEERIRTAEQNAKLHAMCRDFEKQGIEWGGNRWDVESWKRLFLGAKMGQHIVPNPFDHGIICVNKRRSRGLSTEEMAELLSEIEVFGIERGVKWSDDE